MCIDNDIESVMIIKVVKVSTITYQLQSVQVQNISVSR